MGGGYGRWLGRKARKKEVEEGGKEREEGGEGHELGEEETFTHTCHAWAW